MGLLLKPRFGDKIEIGDNIVITYEKDLRRGGGRVNIEAPRDVNIKHIRRKYLVPPTETPPPAPPTDAASEVKTTDLGVEPEQT